MSRALLDTCTFIWLVSEPRKLSRLAKKTIDGADTLILSDVSALEIGLKWRTQKLSLPEPPRSWLSEQVERWKIQWLALSREHIFRTSELELFHHDPFDRMLVAQAMAEGLRIVTPDEHIAKYPVATTW